VLLPGRASCYFRKNLTDSVPIHLFTTVQIAGTEAEKNERIDAYMYIHTHINTNM
jgi:hypothetical protein